MSFHKCNHCSLSFFSISMNKPKNLATIEITPNSTIANHKLKLKLKSSTGAAVPRNSFRANALNAYLNGDRYSSHPYQAEKSARFFRNPPMNIKGIVKEGTTPAAIIIELKMLPVSRPMELPHKQHINAISTNTKK